MDEGDFEEYIAKNNKTSGHKKLNNFTEALFDDPKFISEVKRIRAEFGIPIEPTELDHIQTEDTQGYYKELKKLLLRLKLNYMWEDKLSMFIESNIRDGGSWGTICEVHDVIELTEDPLSDRNNELDNNAFPISLRISPYATQRDLIDYIKSMYATTIKPLQTRYMDKGVSIGKFRTKKEHIKKRNEFIISNKHLPPRQIVSLVADQFGECLDYAHVSKIINLHKRKEVSSDNF